MRINENYEKLQDSYLFSTIAKKVGAFQAEHPQNELIRLGIGDVTLPLCPAVVTAMHQAVDDMGSKARFHGYGPEQGYGFLKEAIAGYYLSHGVRLAKDEIFVSDGAKSDLGNILDLFSRDNTVLVPDPVYPVYADTNVMAGRPIVYLNATKENGFLPMPDETQEADLIYLCSPNNPTGAVYSHDQLEAWVNYANRQGAVILFDAAYEAFIEEPDLPRSIFEIEGSRTCAIEFCSFSKTAGFTGTRCGYTVVPHELEADGRKLNAMWLRRQTTKFNGVSYIVQKGAAAVFTPDGQAQIRQALAYYKENARVLGETLHDLGFWYTGGKNSPYLWFQCPAGLDSWAFFDRLLEGLHLVGAPGAGFGKNGEGFFRITAFGDRQATLRAARRLRRLKE